MPRYYFNISVGPLRCLDLVGRDCIDGKDAVEQAMLAALDAGVAYAGRRHILERHPAVEVIDDERRPLLYLPLSSVVTPMDEADRAANAVCS